MMPWFWPWGVIPIQEKELKELKEKAEAFDKLTISMSEDLQLTPGDFLERKEKAEKWDSIDWSDTPLTEGIAVANYHLLKKLEAIKTWFSEYRYNPSSFKCWKELGEILEGS